MKKERTAPVLGPELHAALEEAFDGAGGISLAHGALLDLAEDAVVLWHAVESESVPLPMSKIQDALWRIACRAKAAALLSAETSTSGRYLTGNEEPPGKPSPPKIKCVVPNDLLDRMREIVEELGALDYREGEAAQ